MVERKSQKRASARGRGKERNSLNSDTNELRTRAVPVRTKIAGDILSGEPISFVEFVTSAKYEPYRRLLCGEAKTAAAKMVAEFAKAKTIPRFFHGNPGTLPDNSKTRNEIRKFARRAYRGDSEGRGAAFWGRVAWLLWNVFASLNALIGRSAKVAKQESELLERKASKRPARAAYMRRYRAKHSNKKRAPKNSFYKPEAIAQWRRQREKRR
jgi:hypothetical protein